jgi:hypothetical protein
MTWIDIMVLLFYFIIILAANIVRQIEDNIIQVNTYRS